jgi:beta-exotoxin I transport system ATP-binding protein
MQDQGHKKTVKCPECGNLVEVHGNPGEKKLITCDLCNLKGMYTFPEEVPTAGTYSTDETVIKVKNLTKTYKDIVAVNNISFSVKKGEIFGFLGPNGAGKTTTIRTLLGFLKPNRGEAYIFGKNIKDNIVEIRKNVGYIPGELALYEHMTGRQFLNYFNNLRNTHLPLLEELLDIFELPLDRKIKGYSKGMKQKMGIVQAFMDDPEIVIMDEPTSGLDPLLQQKFYDFLLNEKRKGRTMFFSSHILSEVDKICDRVAIIRQGDIVALENIENLKKKRGKKIRIKIKENPEPLLQMHNAKIMAGWIEFPSTENIDKLIKSISKFTILDLQIKEFSLEDIFMRYYTTGGMQ